MALRSLRANLFRSLLTLLGIVIGVGSVIAMLAIGDGAKQAVVERIGQMGSNLLLVRPGAPNQRGFSSTATLVVGDVAAIDALPNVQAAVPEQNTNVTLRYRDADLSTSVNGTSAKFPLARQWPLAEGSFFTTEDEAGYATVAVLGQTVARALFPNGESPVGQYVLVNNLLFQVIGVMSARGASPMGQDQDDIVFVPYATSSLRLSGQRFLRNVTVAVEDVGRIDETQSAVEALLLELGGQLFAGGRQAEQPGLELESTGKPVLVVWGTDDKIVPAAHAANAPPGATVERFAGAGHMVQMEKASEVNRLLRQHVGA